MSEIFITDEGGNFKKVGIEEALLLFINKKTPPAMTSRQISEAMSLPYTTIHHRLVTMAEEKRIQRKEDRTMRPGRKSILWEKA